MYINVRHNLGYGVRIFRTFFQVMYFLWDKHFTRFK